MCCIIKEIELPQRPFYHAIGNHCLAMDKKLLMAGLGMENSYYDFQADSWRFIVLDTSELGRHNTPGSWEFMEKEELCSSKPLEDFPEMESYNGGVSSKQVAWLRRCLEDAQEKGEKVVVCGHIPLLPESACPAHCVWNFQDLTQLLLSFSCFKAYFGGHFHRGGYTEKEGRHFVTFEAVLDSDNASACGVVEMGDEYITITGFGDMKSHKLNVFEDHAKRQS
ncbi:hypothetical protein CYMTET_10621 [Cymbomonas tetramitiformis]|uniref:Calcineurin-like phosphoesterase domain-containing protein n=1 Tax=Cymbomonas tetramitiformis TaxID=36881 RepID=A0AAE0LDZ5_9CHLO|nr:hypothetical protein CYMTET_10621 [Cymbomonas tetramitiformis]